MNDHAKDLALLAIIISVLSLTCSVLTFML